MTRFNDLCHGKKERVLMRTRSTAAGIVAVATLAYVASFAMVGVRAQTIVRPRVLPTSLKSLAVPEPPNLAYFIQDKKTAIALGKAFFWDMQASSDNIVACASCHYHAGADDRVKNVINPNLTNMAGDPTCGNVAPYTASNPAPAPACALKTTFDPLPPVPGHKGGPNYTAKAADFPFHQLQDPNDRMSQVLFTTNDVVGSAGVYNSQFTSLLSIFEKQKFSPDGVFQISGVETRKIEPRNTPTVINAALNFRNFWDGRANFVFNGVNPFGPRDKNSKIWIDEWIPDPKTGVLTERAVRAQVRIPFASAASQAVGPILSPFEMSASGRSLADVGKKLLTTRPLLYQQVSATDSVLGPYRNAIGFGLNTTYTALIQKAFLPIYWSVPDKVYQAYSGNTNRQIEQNFSLFWGLAIQMYESTLISDDSRFDRFADGATTALTAQEQHGLAIFSGERGRCVNCHKGAEFTGASTRMVLGSAVGGFGGDGPIERMLMGDKQEAIYDNGFYNIGVVPAGNDRGVGGTDPFGYPLSFAREFKLSLSPVTTFVPDSMSHSLDPCTFQQVEGCTVIRDPKFRDAVDGSFKAPSLRNVELTGPYFHNGGYSTLEQVVDFYNRGGNVRTTVGLGDTSGWGTNTSNFDTEVFRLGLTAAEKAALVAFLKALTDDRVRYERAPFDHPSILVPHGHAGDNTTLTTISGHAIDQFLSIPAVGAAGRTAPILPFSPK